MIDEESDRLAELIDNLLDASRIQAGALKMDRAEVDLTALAMKTVDGFRLQTEAHDFELSFPPDLPTVVADEKRVRQVLSNLLDNAIKYSPDGGTVRVGGWAETGGVTVYVADQGIGIAEADQDRLFERFYRVDSTMRRQTQGAGLGLFLSRAIVEGHGGRMWLSSESDKGTSVFFTLPR